MILLALRDVDPIYIPKGFHDPEKMNKSKQEAPTGFRRMQEQ